MLEVVKPHLFLASETWNKKDTISIHQDYASLISKPANYEGCAIFYRKELEIRPFREHQWTLNYIFAKMHKTIIISVYLNPREPEQQLETVMWHSNQFRDEGYDILMAGDFNLKEDYLREKTEGYHISRNAGATRRGRNANRAIDHIVSTHRMTGVTHVDTRSKSDHIPFQSEVTLELATPETTPIRYNIRKNVTHEQITE